PIVYALARKSKKSTLIYAIPLLAGLGVTHAFIPPTPGPTAVAEIMDVSLGWVIIFGFITGIPAAILAGPVFGKYIGNKIDVTPPDFSETSQASDPALEDKWDFYIILLRSEEHTSELQSRFDLVCRLLLEKTNQSPSR